MKLQQNIFFYQIWILTEKQIVLLATELSIQPTLVAMKVDYLTSYQ